MEGLKNDQPTESFYNFYFSISKFKPWLFSLVLSCMEKFDSNIYYRGFAFFHHFCFGKVDALSVAIVASCCRIGQHGYIVSSLSCFLLFSLNSILPVIKALTPVFFLFAFDRNNWANILFLTFLDHLVLGKSLVQSTELNSAFYLRLSPFACIDITFMFHLMSLIFCPYCKC